MNQKVLDKYGVSFQNTIMDYGISGKDTHKQITINNWIVGSFLTSWNNADAITSLLLPDINNVLNGKSALVENGSETISIDIKPDVVTFYATNVGANYPKIPTMDFLEIVTEWCNFLKEHPINGTKV